MYPITGSSSQNIVSSACSPTQPTGAFILPSRGTFWNGSYVLPTVMWCILDCSFAFLHIHHWFKHITKTNTSFSFEEFVLCPCLNILQQTVTLTLPNLLTLHSVFHPKTSEWQISIVIFVQTAVCRAEILCRHVRGWPSSYQIPHTQLQWFIGYYYQTKTKEHFCISTNLLLYSTFYKTITI